MSALQHRDQPIMCIQNQTVQAVPALVRAVRPTIAARMLSYGNFIINWQLRLPCFGVFRQGTNSQSACGRCSDGWRFNTLHWLPESAPGDDASLWLTSVLRLSRYASASLVWAGAYFTGGQEESWILLSEFYCHWNILQLLRPFYWGKLLFF